MQVFAVGIFFTASGSINTIDDFDEVPEDGLNAAYGVLMFLSLATIIFQIVAIIDLFKRFKLLRMKIPSGNTLWYLSSIIVRLLTS